MKPSTLVYLGIVILISTGLLVLAAGQKSFWYDEAYSAEAAAGGLEALSQAAVEDVHPPLLVFLLGVWGNIFGFGEMGLRSLSIGFAILALLLNFWFARDLFDERVALLGTAMLAFSPLFIMFAHNARYYALSACLSIIITLAMLRFHASGERGYLVLYGLASIVFLYLLYSAAIVILLCNVWWLGLWLGNQPRPADRWRTWFLAQAILLLAYLPGMVWLVQTMGRISDSSVVSQWPVELGKRLAYSSYVFGVGETLSPLNPAAWLGWILVAGLFLWAGLSNWRQAGFWLAASFFVGILLLNGVLSLNSAVSLTWQSLPVRAFYALPYLAICLGAGLAALRPRLALVVGLLLLLVYGLASWNYYSNRQFLRPMIAVPWAEVFADIQQNAQPDSRLICGRGDYACVYYARRNGFTPYRAAQFTELARRPGGDIWWIQTNLGSKTSGDQEEQEILRRALAGRLDVRVTPYAAQDDSIRWLKSHMLGQDDYAYRVQVYRFSLP